MNQIELVTNVAKQNGKWVSQSALSLENDYKCEKSKKDEVSDNRPDRRWINNESLYWVFDNDAQGHGCQKNEIP